MARKNVINYIDSNMKPVDLFIKLKTTKLDAKHQFVEHISEVYGTTEYIWSGYLRNGLSFRFVTSEGKVVPFDDSVSYKGGPGFTFDDEKTCEELCVRNALVIKDESKDNVIYNYSKEDTYVQYAGKFRKVTIFIRVSDNNEGESNSRWLNVNIK